MAATTDIECELMALAEMRFRWRHEPEMLRMIDSALRLITQLAETHDDNVADRLEEEALAWARLMRAAFANLTSLPVH